MTILLPMKTVRASIALVSLVALTACPPKKPDDGGSSCPEATSGCPCAASNRCDTGLTCTNNVCTASGGGTGVVVSSDAVRSCDILLTIANAANVQVTFGTDVIGKSRAKDAKLGLSFTAKADTALSSVAQLKDAAGQALPMSGVAVTQSTCYSRLGVVVADATVSLR